MYTLCVPDMAIANGNLSLPFSLFFVIVVFDRFNNDNIPVIN